MENDSLSIENPTPRPKPKASLLSMPRILINAPMEPKENSWRIDKPTNVAPEDLKEFPVWGLPDDLREFITAVAGSYRCSPSIPTAAMFSAAGTAVGKRAKGQFGVYTTYASPWLIIVGNSSVGKTGASDYVYKPVMDYEEKAFNDYWAAKVAFNQQPKDQRGEPPRLRSRVEGLMTDERLLYKLAENNGALCLKIGELEALFGGMGRYNKGGAGMIVGCLQDIFSHSTLQRSTVSGEPIFISEPALNIYATTQPVKLKQLMEVYLQGRGGFFERFLYVSVKKLKERKDPVPIPPELMEAWRCHIDRLLRLDSCIVTENAQAAEIHKNAVEEWDNNGDMFQAFFDESPRINNYDDVRASCLYKMNYHVCRIAMITALLQGNTVINAPDMRYAVEVAQYLLGNQLAILSMIVSRDNEREPTLEETIRQLYRKKPGLNKSALGRALGVSQEYISKVTKGVVAAAREIPTNGVTIGRDDTQVIV